MSDCGSYAIVIIAMMANPFSPSYASDRARPLDFCSFNVAIYGPRGRLWSLFERRAGPMTARELRIGKSELAWIGDRLVARVDEVTTPGGRPIRGGVTLIPEASFAHPLVLDDVGAHGWWPVAPLARVEVELEEPSLRFSGHGYHDANAGLSPLEDTFRAWSWARARGEDSAIVTYDVTLRDGRRQARALAFDPSGARSLDGLARTPVRLSSWFLSRAALTDAGAPARVARTLEDGPFYARALVSARVLGREHLFMHETLDGDRLRSRVVKRMLRYRMGFE